MTCINLHHVGIWADDVNEMVEFLTKGMGFRLLTRTRRSPTDSFERLFVHLGENQVFEILSKSDMQPRPNIPAHMAGSNPVIGIPHICFRVTDLPILEKKIQSLGYHIHLKIPEQGYGHFELGSVRAIWFTGPSGVDFELFEFEEEYPLEQLPQE